MIIYRNILLGLIKLVKEFCEPRTTTLQSWLRGRTLCDIRHVPPRKDGASRWCGVKEEIRSDLISQALNRLLHSQS